MSDRIDLHSHSTCSDGTESVADLFEQARQAQLDVLALTDHDTAEGWGQLPAAVAASGVTALPGIEVSAEHERLSVHVLALLVDPDADTALGGEMAQSRAARRERARRMVDLIAADHPLTWEDVTAQVAGEQTVIGRPHIADALVAAGAAADRSAAFDSILSSDGPYYVPYYAPSPVRVIEAIRAAGGVSIAAHPGSLTRGANLPIELLEAMIAAGLDGIEVDHREHEGPERARLRELADRHDLLITGGSDFHGTGKPNRLGENLTSPRMLERVLERATSGTEVLRP